MDVDCDPDLVSDRSVYFYFDLDVSEKIDQKTSAIPKRRLLEEKI